MQVSGQLFTASWLVWLGAPLLFALWKALRWADWKRLADRRQLHVYLGSIVALMLLWSLRTQIEPGLSWHLSGMVTVTLMFGWSLAVIGGCFSLAGVTLSGLSDWGGYIPTALLLVVLPASLTQVALGLARAYLPKHYFIYVFVNAFFGAGLIAVASALATTGLLVAVDAYTWKMLKDTYLLFLPLMFFPEAVLNGWLMSILVSFRPEWVSSFRDEEYLDDK